MAWWQRPLRGGAMIGAGAVLLMIGAGRVAGVSGILGGLLPPADNAGWGWRAAFITGLAVGPVLVGWWLGRDVVAPSPISLPLLGIAGLLVGLGVGLGRGCTSGHGVCGLARLSARSVVATGVFMAVAVATVFVVRHMQ